MQEANAVGEAQVCDQLQLAGVVPPRATHHQQVVGNRRGELMEGAQQVRKVPLRKQHADEQQELRRQRVTLSCGLELVLCRYRTKYLAAAVIDPPDPAVGKAVELLEVTRHHVGNG